MKNFLSMAALALMGAMMTGCSNDDNFDNPQQPENKSKVVTLTTTVGFADGATTRALTADGVKTFAVDDQIAVIYTKNGGTVTKAVSEKLISTDIASGSKSATFTVTLDDPDKTKNVTYIYPAAMAGETGVDLTKLNTQEGTFEALQSKYDLCTKSGAWDAGNLPSLTLENQLAILAVTLKDNAATPAEITNTITGMTISIGAYNYSVTRDAAAGPIYVAIRPTTSANIKIYASDGSNYYNKNLTGKTYAADNGYNVSWKMPGALLSAATTADYGMVVCAAGHLHLAKTAVPGGCTAVGILGNVTETGHGLILALQDAIWQDGNTINGWDSETDYAGTTLKQLPDDAARGSLTSYTTLGSTTVSNWCVAQKSDYETIFINLGSTTADEDGTTYDYNVNAYITTGVGGTAIDGDYWSATVKLMQNWHFSEFSWTGRMKNETNRLRPVLGF